MGWHCPGQSRFPVLSACPVICGAGPGNPEEAWKAAPVLWVGAPLALQGALGLSCRLLAFYPGSQGHPAPGGGGPVPLWPPDWPLPFRLPPTCLATPSSRLQEAGIQVVSGIPALSWEFWPPSWLWLSRCPAASTLDTVFSGGFWLCERFSVGWNLLCASGLCQALYSLWRTPSPCLPYEQCLS